MAIIPIPKPLREKLGEEGTEALIQVLNENGKEIQSSSVELSVQRFEKTLSREIAGVSVQIADVEKRFDKRLIEEISGVRTEIADVEKRFDKRLTEEISGVRTDLGAEIAAVHVSIEKSKSDLIKWMFIFWIGQIGVLVGILYTLFK